MIHTFGKVSLKQTIINKMSTTVKDREKRAGLLNHIDVKSDKVAAFEKYAPIRGPTTNPIEKAIPIIAWKQIDLLKLNII